VTGRFEDDRGVIQDLFGGEPIDAVTRITTKRGHVRGNHVHKETHQWTYVMNGSLEFANGNKRKTIGEGNIVYHPPGVPHAWKALEDTECLVFTRGPRSGEGYEDDTYRLDEPLLT
jgi:quercetin dioxygenase-like cupin family protein